MKFGKLKFSALIAAAMVAAGAWAMAADAPAEPARPIVIQATTFNAQGGGAVTVHKGEIKASLAYVHEWCTTGHWLEWTIDNAEPGPYDLWLRYGDKYQTAREVCLNGRPVKGLESVRLASTGDWAEMKDAKAPAPITLSPGKNILRITCLDNNSLWLNQIKLNGGGKSIVIDPAAFTGQGGGQAQAIISDAHGFFSGWDKKGLAFEWTIPNAPAGDYTLTLGCATLDVPFRELRVNGDLALGLEAFSVKYTNGWRNWCEDTLPAKVSLRQGRNVLRMANISGALNMSYLRLSAPGKPDIFINAIDFTSETGGTVQVHPPAVSYFSGWDRTGQWLEWKFNAPAAGLYDMTLRYKPPPDIHHGTMPVEPLSPREFRLNGVVVRGLEAYMIPGVSPRDWLESKLPIPLNLKAGENILRITNLEPGSLDLIEMRLSPAQDPPPAPPR